MRVYDLTEMNAIDTTIQSLLGELQDLYVKRVSLVEPKHAKNSKQLSKRNLNDVSLDDIDLSLHDPIQPKRYGIFTTALRH